MSGESKPASLARASSSRCFASASFFLCVGCFLDRGFYLSLGLLLLLQSPHFVQDRDVQLDMRRFERVGGLERDEERNETVSLRLWNSGQGNA